MEQKQYAPEVAAWIKKDKNGNEFLSVKLKDGTWVNLFRNKFKQSDKAPDWKEAKPKDQSAPQSKPDDSFPF